MMTCKCCKEESALCSKFSKLWLDHVYLTRTFIISALTSLPSLGDATTQLNQNPNDFGNLLIQFYGPVNAAEFTRLFSDHLTIAAKIVFGLRDSNMQVIKYYTSLWYKNADDISRLLSSINSNWPYNVMHEMMYEHLRLTTDEAVKYNSGQYADSSAVFKAIEISALEMANAFAKGIAAQFQLTKCGC